jgi:signal peptidase I
MAVVFVVVLQAVRVFAFQGYLIPSGSMEETLMIGDRVIAEKVSYYFRDVEPGDIVIFEDPNIPGRILVKRCVAVGGQTVDLRDGQLFVDGVAQNEPYTLGKQSVPLARTSVDISYPYFVPEGTIWVMGDNRTNSQDARYFGPINLTSVYGRALMIYWPLEHVHVFE